METCGRCGAKVSPMTAVYGGVDTRTRQRISPFCSEECRNANAVEYAVARIRCAACPRMFTRERDATGRPRKFCSDKCQKAHAAAIARALRALSNGRSGLPSQPGESAEQLVRHLAELESYDADMRLLASKLKAEPDTAPELSRAVNGSRHLCAERIDQAQRLLRLTQESEREHRREVGTSSAVKARIRARADQLQAAIAKQKVDNK
ncbi:hypothetical protein ABN034_19340 [Actinopolymorpha sp. B11F2]|uniref:hypothetical protein n=1 Tax=Actinopolymorpha sp. B11F2 TaxID=3160862 RepID=UPI0032E3ECA2